MRPLALSSLLVFSMSAFAQADKPAASPALTPVKLTNPKAINDVQKYRDVLFRLDPEVGSVEGASKYDSKIADVSINGERSRHKELEGALKKLQQVAEKEGDPDAKKEVAGYIEYQQALLQQEEQALDHNVTFISAATYVSNGLKPLLDPSAPGSRHTAGGERLKRYVGIDPDPQGNQKLTENASMSRSTAPMTGVSQGTASDNSLVTALITRMTAQMKKPDAIYPARGDVIFALSHTNEVLNGTLDALRKSGLAGWETPFALLQREIVVYDDWVKTNLLPKCK